MIRRSCFMARKTQPSVMQWNLAHVSIASLTIDLEIKNDPNMVWSIHLRSPPLQPPSLQKQVSFLFCRQVLLYNTCFYPRKQKSVPPVVFFFEIRFLFSSPSRSQSRNVSKSTYLLSFQRWVSNIASVGCSRSQSCFSVARRGCPMSKRVVRSDIK